MKETICSWNERFKWVKQNFSNYYVIVNKQLGTDFTIFMHSNGLDEYGKAIDKLYKSVGTSKTWTATVVSTLEVSDNSALFLFQVMDQKGFVCEQIRRFKIPTFEATLFFLDNEILESHYDCNERILDMTFDSEIRKDINDIYGDVSCSKVMNSLFKEEFPFNPDRIRPFIPKVRVLNKYLTILCD